MFRNIHGSTLTRSRWAGIGAAVAVSLGAGGIGFIAHAANSATSSFVSITPCRLFDTRPAPANVGAGTWTSTKTGPGQYQITVPGLEPGCAISKPLPNPVVTVWNNGAITTASAYINGVGSSCVSGNWFFYVQTTLNGAAADSDFTFEFVTPV
ncbi:MAG: hypothetical protein ABI862_15570 [Ilumatobacteraceae bacterium]